MRYFTAQFRDPLTGGTFTRNYRAYRRGDAYYEADTYAEAMDCDLISFREA